MTLFRTKGGEVFDLDDLSRIVKSHKDDDGNWVYVLAHKAYVHGGSNPCPLCIDQEEYDTLMRYFHETGDPFNRIGWWQ